MTSQETEPHRGRPEPDSTNRDLGDVKIAGSPAGPCARRQGGRRSRLSPEAIIKTAAACFYADGYADTTLGTVAGQLGVTDKAIYYYFPSKDALYLEAVNCCIDWVTAVLDSIAERELTGRDKIKAVARILVRQSAARRPCLRMLPDHLEDTELGRRFRRIERVQEETLVGWIRDGIADGTIRAADPRLLWKWNQGALLWLDSWARTSNNYDPDIIERAAMTMLDRSLGAPSELREDG